MPVRSVYSSDLRLSGHRTARIEPTICRVVALKCSGIGGAPMLRLYLRLRVPSQRGVDARPDIVRLDLGQMTVAAGATHVLVDHGCSMLVPAPLLPGHDRGFGVGRLVRRSRRCLDGSRWCGPLVGVMRADRPAETRLAGLDSYGGGGGSIGVDHHRDRERHHVVVVQDGAEFS
jgi:hypothetical protein